MRFRLPSLLLLLVMLALPAMAAPPPAEAATAVNVNTATVAVLRTLKGIGEKKAKAIVAFRKAHGPFRSLDDFEQVPGIGPALIDRNQHRIVFE